MGPCRILAEGGFARGLLAPRLQLKVWFFSSKLNASRFLLIFAACLVSLVGKGLALAAPFGTGFDVSSEDKFPVIAATLATIFLPGLILGIASCWHRGFLKTFLAHPSIVLMPAFTHFAFGSSRNWFKRRLTEEESKKEGEQEEKQETGEEEEPFVTFSTTFTLANVLLSSLAMLSLASA